MDRIHAQEIVQGMVAHEECRQEEMKSHGKFEFTAYDALMTDAQRLSCLMEEVGEVSRCVMARMYLTHEAEERPDERILSELAQVAAIAQAWMERIVYNKHPIDVETGLRRSDQVGEPEPEKRSGNDRRVTSEQEAGRRLTQLGIEDRREYQRRKAMLCGRRAVVSYPVEASDAEKIQACLEGLRECAADALSNGCSVSSVVAELEQVANDAVCGELV